MRGEVLGSSLIPHAVPHATANFLSVSGRLCSSSEDDASDKASILLSLSSAVKVSSISLVIVSAFNSMTISALGVTSSGSSIGNGDGRQL